MNQQKPCPGYFPDPFGNRGTYIPPNPQEAINRSDDGRYQGFFGCKHQPTPRGFQEIHGSQEDSKPLEFDPKDTINIITMMSLLWKIASGYRFDPNEPYVTNCISYMLLMGMIEVDPEHHSPNPNEFKFIVTEGGRLYIQRIKNVETPVCQTVRFKIWA